MEKPFKILSIDGGGIRGIIPCRILKFIEEEVGPLSDTFDLIAGTSTGGIITLGLTKPTYQGDNAFSAEDMLDLYVKNGAKIFGERHQSKLNKVAQIGPKQGKELTQKPYKIDDFEALLVEKFDGARLNDSLTNVLITTYDLEKGKPFYFLSREARKSPEKENFLYTDIARSTSAAPTFFTPSIVNQGKNKEFGFIDGGVFANNPAILAYIEAKELAKQGGTKAFSTEATPDDNDLPFFMLSIGTGYYNKSISAEKAKEFSTMNWLEPLVKDIFMRGVTESTNHTMKHLLPNYLDGTPRYHRIDFKIPEENAEMDNVSKENIEALQALADKYVADNARELIRISQYLM